MLVLSAGKGGTGKTTVTALLGIAHASLGGTVLEIDCDTNQKLHKQHLNADEPPPLAEVIEAHLEMLYGRNNYVSSFATAPKSTPPSPSSPLFHGVSATTNPLVSAASVVQRDGVISMRTGELSADEQVNHCNHFLTGAGLRLGLHTVTQPGELLIADMMAGNDNGTSGLPSIADGAFIVVGPTEESLDSYEQIAASYHDFAIPNIVVVANQVEDDDDLDFIRAGVRHQVTCVLPRDKRYFRQLKSGVAAPPPPEIASGIAQLHSAIRSWKPRDPQEKFLSAVAFHNLNYPDNAIPDNVARIGAQSYARRVRQGPPIQNEPRHTGGPRSGVARGTHPGATTTPNTGSVSHGDGPMKR